MWREAWSFKTLVTYTTLHDFTTRRLRPEDYFIIIYFLYGNILLAQNCTFLEWRRAGIAQWYSDRLRDGRSGVRIPEGPENFSLQDRVQTESGGHPASYPMDIRALSLRIKWPGRETDHSLLSSIKAKNAWSYTSSPPIRHHDVVLS
jgi:hypothetical protein